MIYVILQIIFTSCMLDFLMGAMLKSRDPVSPRRLQQESVACRMPHAACRMPHPQGCRIYIPGLGSLLTGPTDYLITALNPVRNKKLQPETGLKTFQEMLAAVYIKRVAKYVPVERIGALQASLGPPAIHHDLRQPDPRKLVESDPITASRLRCPP